MNTLYYRYALGRLLHGLLLCRKPTSWMVRLALLLLFGLLAGWISLGTQSAIAWVFATLVLGTLMLLAQSSLRQIRHDFRDDIEHQVLVIGVGDSRGLMAAVPAHIRGQRVSYELPQPMHSLPHLLSVEQKISETLHCQSPTGVKVIYAGHAPSPIAFLMGFYLGNTRIDAIMDSTETSHSWQLLDALDDAARFEIAGLEQLKPGMREVTLIMRCGDGDGDSPIHDALTWPDLHHPVVSMVLPGSKQACLSASKQTCLANQFGAVLHALAGHGITTVHLHYAGPHSLLFNLGRQYRRLQQPAIIVYSEGNAKSEHWGMRIPASVHEPAKIIGTLAAEHRMEHGISPPPPLRLQAAQKACGLGC